MGTTQKAVIKSLIIRKDGARLLVNTQNLLLDNSQRYICCRGAGGGLREAVR